MRMLALFAAAVVTLAAPARAVTITYSATLAPEVVGATGSGSATVVYDTVLNSLSVSATWTGLSSPTTVAHIHCCVAVAGTGTVGVAVTPATLPGFPVGLTGGTYTTVPVLDLTLASTYTGTFVTASGGTLAGAQAAIIAGMTGGTAYFNIHSTAFPSGEIRGFLSPVPEPGLGLLLLSAAALLPLARRRRRTEARVQ